MSLESTSKAGGLTGFSAFWDGFEFLPYLIVKNYPLSISLAPVLQINLTSRFPKDPDSKDYS